LPGIKDFDTERTYDNIMHRFKFGGLDKKGIYLDETVMRMCYTHRRIMTKLALELLYEKKDKKALEVLNYTEKMIPDYNVAHCYESGSLDMARSWAILGQHQKAVSILNSMWNNSVQYVKWYCSLGGFRFDGAKYDIIKHLYIMQQIVGLTDTFDQKLADKQMQQLAVLNNLYEQRGGSMYEEE